MAFSFKWPYKLENLYILFLFLVTFPFLSFRASIYFFYLYLLQIEYVLSWSFFFPHFPFICLFHSALSILSLSFYVNIYLFIHQFCCWLVFTCLIAILLIFPFISTAFLIIFVNWLFIFSMLFSTKLRIYSLFSPEIQWHYLWSYLDTYFWK